MVRYDYSSTRSQSMSDASVPPTVTIELSPYKKRAQAIIPEYTLVSKYSLLGLMHGYLKSRI